MAIFDDRLSIDEKRVIVGRLKTIKPAKDPKMKKKGKFEDQASISEFINQSGMEIFSILNLSSSFLDIDPLFWLEDITFQECKSKIQSLSPVNDAAERAIGLITRVKNNSTKWKNEEVVENKVFNIERDLKV